MFLGRPENHRLTFDGRCEHLRHRNLELLFLPGFPSDYDQGMTKRVVGGGGWSESGVAKLAMRGPLAPKPDRGAGPA